MSHAFPSLPIADAAEGLQTVCTHAELGAICVHCQCRAGVKKIMVSLGYSALGPAPKKFLAAPVADCSYVLYFNKYKGRGAMKYSPVDCNRVLDLASCEYLRALRGYGKIQFNFEMILSSGCTAFDRKILTVPSIGCPKLLANKKFCEQLLWAANARERPTYLVVHAMEAEVYLYRLGGLLAELGVGIITWSCEQPVLGFGVSRLAAQEIGLSYGRRRSKMVMSDVNVTAMNNLKDGYASDKEGTVTKDVKSQSLYLAAGLGSGVPLVAWTGEALKKNSNKQGEDGRPLEQVVTVGDWLQYDPCFIASSEDADMTQAFLHQENVLRSRDIGKNAFRRTRYIVKVDLATGLPEKTIGPVLDQLERELLAHHASASQGDGGGDKALAEDDVEADSVDDIDPASAEEATEDPDHTNAYRLARDQYLRSLSWEDGVPIYYMGSATTAGELAKSLADQHGLNPLVIRSCIIEKILLSYKDAKRAEELAEIRQ
jgi:hypothetical protein